jgi:hypothetical protein
METLALTFRQANISTQLFCLLEDARRVVLANRYIVDIAPLQIYSSAMVFAPQNSMVKEICGQIPAWLKRFPITPATWSPELQKLEGHTSWVSAVGLLAGRLAAGVGLGRSDRQAVEPEHGAGSAGAAGPHELGQRGGPSRRTARCWRRPHTIGPSGCATRARGRFPCVEGVVH